MTDNFANVRRTALVLKPKQPFIDWLNSIDPADNTADLIAEPNIYLLPDFEELSEMENWLTENFDALFCEQLMMWYVDEDLWVKDRTYKMFKDWFDYSLHTMVWDTVDGPIKKLI